ncbi:EAL domain-containing protein [Schleiferilactobacillus shenzhenensis]|uniref:EAL domain-containing protein n=1 Tax=Schleiferilactobacillus shenzhenensis TaxID=1231337 RepID=UPI00068C415E|nr:EAL domain-containing protein [Schleiferilactobacillus shenzhenensis]
MIEAAWIVSLICLSLAAAGAVVLVRQRRRRVAPTSPETPQRRYFMEPQVNAASRVVGYECLLRERTATGTWAAPAVPPALPLTQVRDLLGPTLAQLPEAPIALALNLTAGQITSPDFLPFVRWARRAIAPLYLVIDYRSTGIPSHRRQRQFRQQVRLAQDEGCRFAADNVGSDLCALKNIEWLLPVVDILKCSVAAFRKDDPSIWLDLNLGFWNRLAKERQIDLVLTGVETDEDAALAQELKIQFRQGKLVGEAVAVPDFVPAPTERVRPRTEEHVEHIE